MKTKYALALLLAALLSFPLAAQIPEVPVAPEIEEMEEMEEMEELMIAPEIEEIEEMEEIGEIGEIEEIEEMEEWDEDWESEEAPEKTRVTMGQNEVLIVEENGDTMRVKLGSRGLSIVEGENGTEIKVLDMDEEEKAERDLRRDKKFKPHWAGVNVGLNNYLTPGGSMVLPSGQSFMELNTGKSWSWDVNFLEYGLGFGTSYAGLVTGMGFEFTNYVFEGQNNIVKDPVSGDMVAYVPDYADNITKSKLNITYLTAPLLLEFQIPAGKKRIHLSGGVIGGVKLASNSKLKYTENGDKSKEKFKGNFNLSPLRWGVTARAGYRSLNLFATYYMTPLFIPGSEPELYPFSVGLTLTPF